MIFADKKENSFVKVRVNCKKIKKLLKDNMY